MRELTERIRRLRQSLLSRYLLIILAALLFIPVVFPLSLVIYGTINTVDIPPRPADYALYESRTKLTDMFHQEALQLEGAPAEKIRQRLRELGQQYGRAALFYVDAGGTTQLTVPPVIPWPAGEPVLAIPDQWTPAEAVSFMKRSADQEPFAIVAFIGDRAEAGEGFIVLQLPEGIGRRAAVDYLNPWWYILLLTLFFFGFAVVSWLFFSGIRKRLLRLQKAMSVTGLDGVPKPISLGQPDEIGRLEQAFNHMVDELADSRRREAEEEGLRKRLVADLSHDLRTPLTVIRSHVHLIGKEQLTARGTQSLKLMDERISDLSALIENLLSYNLLHSGRVTLDLQRKEVLRLLRESAASWYPLWEKEGFEVEIDLEAEPLYWVIDEVWFRRILDNLFQNIMRHAGSGLYVGINIQVRHGHRAIVIADRGRGIGSPSESGGAGLGLSIVELLLKRMKLDWEMDSSEQGTAITIFSLQEKNLNQT